MELLIDALNQLYPQIRREIQAARGELVERSSALPGVPTVRSQRARIRSDLVLASQARRNASGVVERLKREARRILALSDVGQRFADGAARRARAA